MPDLKGWKKCKHGLRICSRCVVVSDAAKRVHEAIGIALTFHTFDETRHSWMAFKLIDGSTDHTLYPSKSAAVSHVSNEKLYCFVFLGNCPAGMPERDAQLWMDFQRHAYDSGYDLSAPNVDLIFPLARGGSGLWHSNG